MKRHWIKLWWRWYRSDSHAYLSPAALHTGPHLLLIAGRNVDDEGRGWLLMPDGSPHTSTTLAELLRWNKRKTEAILNELRSKTGGTLTKVGDAWCFPKWLDYQESRDAERKREKRKDGMSAECPRNVRGKQKQKQKQKQSKDIQADKPPADPLDYASIIGAMTAAQQSLEPKRKGPRNTASLRRQIQRTAKSCDATTEDWIAVVNAQRDSVRHKPEAWRFLSFSTLCKPNNFRRTLEWAGTSTQSSGRYEPVAGDDYPIGEIQL